MVSKSEHCLWVRSIILSPVNSCAHFLSLKSAGDDWALWVIIVPNLFRGWTTTLICDGHHILILSSTLQDSNPFIITHFVYFATLFWWFWECRIVFFQRKGLLQIPWVHGRFQFSGNWLWIFFWVWDKTNKYCPGIPYETSESPMPTLDVTG